MKSSKKTVALSLALIAALTSSAGLFAEESNAKRGRVYFKMVCTVCHMTDAGKAIPPSSRSMAEWAAYMDADKHDATGKTNPSVKYFVSQEYRASIADTNKAAQKFLDLPDDQLFVDVREFTITGAKDSDTPASCE